MTGDASSRAVRQRNLDDRRPRLWRRGAALVIVGAAQVRTSRVFSANFVKLYGLIFVATLAAAVVFPDIDADVRTGVYTILGTIAGYLAGSRPTATPPAPSQTGGTAASGSGEMSL